jgi:hypothetical protein
MYSVYEEISNDIIIMKISVKYDMKGVKVGIRQNDVISHHNRIFSQLGAEAGELNLLSLAFQLKNAPKVLKIPEEITASSIINRTLPDIEVPLILLGNNTAEEKKPSFFLSNNQWVGKVCTSFKGIVRVEPNVVESHSASFVEVDHLYKILLLRLQQHLHLRVNDKTKHNNYSINWFHANLPRFCAIVFLSKHNTTDL